MATKTPPVLLSAQELADAFTSALEVKDVEVHDGVCVRVRALSKRQQMVLAKLDPEEHPEHVKHAVSGE